MDKPALTDKLKELHWFENSHTATNNTQKNPVQIFSINLPKDWVLSDEHKDLSLAERAAKLITRINKLDSKIDAKLPKVTEQNFGKPEQYRIEIGNREAFVNAFPDIKTISRPRLVDKLKELDWHETIYTDNETQMRSKSLPKNEAEGLIEHINIANPRIGANLHPTDTKEGTYQINIKDWQAFSETFPEVKAALKAEMLRKYRPSKKVSEITSITSSASPARR